MHDGVDVSVVDAVEGVRGAGGQSSAHQNRDGCSDGGKALRGKKHCGDGRDEKKFDDAGFRESNVRTHCLTDAAASRDRGGHARLPSEVSCSSKCCCY